MINVPDDWDNYWRTCSRCGSRYHCSEYCSCNDLTDEELARSKDAEAEYLIELYEKYEDEQHD